MKITNYLYLLPYGRRLLLFAFLAALFIVSPISFSIPNQKVSTQETKTMLSDGRWLVFGETTKIFDPGTGQYFEIVSDIHQQRKGHTATVLPDGTVFIFGGVEINGRIAIAAELFHPDTLEFEQISFATLTGRTNHSATLLTDGRVLIVGGIGNNGEVLQTAELFDWQSQLTQVVSGNLAIGRSEHKAALQGDGSVMFWGGKDRSGSSLKNAERFDPESQRFEYASFRSSIPGPTELVGSIPASGDVNVPIDARLSLRFSQRLFVDSVNEKNIILTNNGNTVPSKIVAAENGMLVFVTPKEKLSSGTNYILNVKGLSDERRQLIRNFSFFFTTIGRGESERPDVDTEDLDWYPQPKGYFEKWRMGETRSPWQSLPALKAANGVTAVSGQALKFNGDPLPNVTIRIGDVNAVTDNTGRFLAVNVTAGVRQMIIDGRTANTHNRKYGVFIPRIDVYEGKTNVLPFTIWLGRLDMKNSINLPPTPTTSEIVYTTPIIPGLQIRIPAGTLMRDIDGNVVTKFSVTPIPMDHGPMPGPVGAVEIPYLFTMQPGGSTIEGSGLTVIHPNYNQAPPGTKIPLWRPDRQIGWMMYGDGVVSADGTQVIPEPDARVFMLSCNALGPPSSAPEEAIKCDKDDCKCMAGNPVGCGTGLKIESNVDVHLPDVIPILFQRTYRSNDYYIRPFGMGNSHSYELFLVGDFVTYSYAELVLADGNRIYYNRTSPGTNFHDAVMEHTSTDGPFHKSVLSWNASIAAWDLKLRNGTIYQFVLAIPAEKIMLSAIIDRNGNRLTIERDLLNSDFAVRARIVKITSPNGKWISFNYGCSNCLTVTQVTDNIGRIVNYTYNGSTLWKVTDPNGGITEYTYETGTGRLLTVKNPRNFIRVTNEYNAAGRVFRQTLADNTTYQLAYTLDGNNKVIQTDITNPRGHIRRITFNAEGYPLTDTDGFGTPEQQTTTYEYQSGTNLLLSEIDPLNRKTSYSHDATGNLTSVTELDGTSEAVTTIFTYEPVFNQIATITNPLNYTTTFSYDSKGNLISTIDPLGNKTTIAYNSAGQPVSIMDPLGNKSQFSYYAGQLVSKTNPLGHSVTQFTDAAGRLISVTNPLGLSVRNEYDPLNRVTKSIDPMQGTISFSYDANSNLLSVTDPRNNPTGYAYNNMDRRTTRTDPLLRNETYLYDNNGNLQQLTDRKVPAQVTTYTYDPLNRIKQVQYQGGSTTSYTYDTGDRMTQVVDSISGTITIGYDNFDRLTSQTTPQGTITYTYDDAGRRETMTVAGLPTVNYTYDNADRLTQITQGGATTTTTHDAAGRLTSMTLPNGIVAEYIYDKGSQLLAITYRQGSTVIGDLTYEYDKTGWRTKVGGSFARTGLPSALISATYNAANHQLAFGAQSLTYDNNGSLTNDGVNAYNWNSRNQLISMTGPGLNATFQYDGLGRRMSKTINGTSTAFLYDGFNPVQELSGATPTANLMTGLGIDQFFSRTDASGTRYLLTDSLNSTVALTDSSTGVQTEYKYEPFGKVSVSGSVNSNSYQYTGRENDATGLLYYRARYYHSSLQRFTSEDPLGFDSGDVNFYSYVRNNPVNFIDPSGLEHVQEPGFTKPLSAIGPLSEAPPVIQAAFYIQGIALIGAVTHGAIVVGGAISNASATATAFITSIPAILNPVAQNPRLQRAIEALFQVTDKIRGGTAAAIRCELKTGQLVGGRSHIQKGWDRARQLTNILNEEDLTPSDRATAVELLRDLINALTGK